MLSRLELESSEEKKLLKLFEYIDQRGIKSYKTLIKVAERETPNYCKPSTLKLIFKYVQVIEAYIG